MTGAGERGLPGCGSEKRVSLRGTAEKALQRWPRSWLPPTRLRTHDSPGGPESPRDSLRPQETALLTPCFLLMYRDGGDLKGGAPDYVQEASGHWANDRV